MISAAAAFLLLINIQSAAPSEAELIASQKNLVKTLYLKKMYFDCAAETRRLTAFDPEPLRAPDYNYFIMINYYRGKQFKTVSSSAAASANGGSDLRINFIHAYSILGAGYPTEALTPLAGFDYSSIKPDIRGELMARRVDLMLYSGDYPAALKEIENSEPFLPEGSVFSLKRAIAHSSDMNFKSPVLASILSSVIPGAGQIYNGSFSGAALTLLSAALPSAAAWWAFGSGRSQLGYAAAGFGAVFYVGGVYGAWKGASRANDLMRGRFSRKIRSEYLGIYDPENYLDTGTLLR